ncbi:MAG: hypothetical protein ACKKMS_03410 [Candidatus Nealsonbacteria bacterium]
MLNRTELEVPKEVRTKVRALRKGFNKLMTEQRKMDQVARDRYFPQEESCKIARATREKAKSLLKKSGIDSETFRKALLLYESIEQEKTGKDYTSSTWVLFWAGGLELFGYSGE